MSSNVGRSVPFWRVPEVRNIRPELWLMAVAVVGMLLVEVWQSARMTELNLALDSSRGALMQERSRLEFDRASMDRGTTRSELDPLAARLGLEPVGVRQQQIDLPGDYLVRDPGTPSRSSGTLVAWLDRVTGALVPEARAKSRTGN